MDDQWRKEAIGRRIKAARSELNLSQKNLQEKTNIKDSMISDFEHGKREPSLANLAKIAHALNTTIDNLYYGDSSNSFIESAPNYGMKIVNCFTELMLNDEIGRVNVDEYNTMPYIDMKKNAWAVRRLLEALYEFKQNEETYPNPDLYLDQIKQSVTNEINGEKNNV